MPRRIKKTVETARASRPPTARMLQIHEALAQGMYPNCQGLAEKLEVTAKTVQRDIDFMRDQLLLPIAYDARKFGFFYEKRVERFPLVSVSQGELVALLVAQKAVEQYRGTPFERPLQSAFEKLASSLDDKTNVSLHSLSKAVSFRTTGVGYAEMVNYEKLTRAITDCKVVCFDYRGMADNASAQRTVEPLHLVCIDAQWYMVGKDRSREAVRTFALTRMNRMRVMVEKFEKDEKFSLSNMLDAGFASFEGKKPETVVLEFEKVAARFVDERKWHPSQRTKWIECERLRLTLRVSIAPDLVKWIMGWGAAVRVVAPDSLRKTIATEHRQALKNYV